MAKVTISGSKPYSGRSLEEEDTSIVKLTDGWYDKRDPAIICIKNRFYRKNSPLLVELASREYGTGNFILREDSIEYDGEFFLKRDCTKESLLQFNPFSIKDQDIPLNVRSFASINFISDEGVKFYCRTTGITSLEIDNYLSRSLTGCYFLSGDPNYITVIAAGKSPDVSRYGSITIADMERKIHSSELEQAIESGNVYSLNGKYYWHASLMFTYNHRGERVRPMCSSQEYKLMSKSDRAKLVDEFCIEERKFIHGGQRSNIERVIFGSIEKSLIDKSCGNKNLNLTYSKELEVYSEENIDKIISDYEKSGKSIEICKEVLSNNYFPQPIPLRCTPFAKNEGGNYLFYESSDRNVEIKGGKILTGNCGYTFGVEIETSVGLIPKMVVEKLSLKGVGDRSIGAIEYVTKPLYGNKGMLLLKQTVEELAKYTAVDKRCGIHVHIGGSGIDESPAFNRPFSLNAVKLGCMLEAEMFEIVPPERTESKNREGMSYCGKFASQFSEISKDNWKEMLGNFVFGHPYSDEHNKKTKLSRWVSSRYKWLNLVNCNSNNEGRSDAGQRTSKFETIEFRLWDGSLVWEDVYAFVIISMAFTKFVENHQRKIMKYNSITVSEVVYSTMRKSVADEIVNWIELRKEKVKKLTNKK